jgi:hypothetical protein
MPLAGGTVFQMDQTKPPNQDILWALRKRGQDTDLDCGQRLRPRSHCKKGTQAGEKHEPDFANFEPVTF